MATHDTGGGVRIKRIDEPGHVLIIISAFDKKLQESADRHIGDRIEPVEFDTVLGAEFFLELGFDGLLFWRQERSDGIVDKIQGKPAVRSTIAEAVQETKRFYRLLEDSVATLCIGLARAVRRKRGDDLDSMASEKFPQVGLRGDQQHGEVAAIHHLPSESAGLFDQPTEPGVEFWRSSCDVYSWDVGLGQSLNTLLRCLQGHGLGTIRAGVHMAVTTSLVTELADIDLKDAYSCRTERVEAGSMELRIKRGV